jgi:hypothetical protein
MTDFLRVDARMALARYESSVAAFGMEAGFPMKDVHVVQEYIEKLETMLLKSADRIEKLEAALRTIYECCDETGNCSVVRRIASKALETDNARP